MAFCSVSAPSEVGIPEEMVVTAPFAYVRFHGTSEWYDHSYSQDELDIWARRIAGREGDLDLIYCYFNNDVDANAPLDARALEALLEEGSGVSDAP